MPRPYIFYPDLQGSMSFGLGTRYSADLDKFVHKTQTKEEICRFLHGFGYNLECFHVCLYRLTSFFADIWQSLQNPTMKRNRVSRRANAWRTTLAGDVCF